MALCVYIHIIRRKHKMGFFDKFADLIGSNVNAMLEKAQDPVKLAKYEVASDIERLKKEMGLA